MKQIMSRRINFKIDATPRLSCRVTFAEDPCHFQRCTGVTLARLAKAKDKSRL